MFCSGNGLFQVFFRFESWKKLLNHTLTVLKSNIPETVDRTQEVGISSISSGSHAIEISRFESAFQKCIERNLGRF
jgi:hypothetical protein